MKLKSYIIGAFAAALLMPATACQDDFDTMKVTAPVATLQPTMTILELKKNYWNDATNFIRPIGGYWKDANGDSITFTENTSLEGATFVPDDKQYVISGRVASSDESGNIYKNMVIQDETAAITLSINYTNLYLKYRVGQEVLIDLKGMYIGKYNGLMQLGMPEWYANGNAWEATFMGNEFFERHVQLNGWPEPEKVDTIVINSFADLPSNPDGLQKYQSQLVRFNNVSFANAGKETFAKYQETVNQSLNDAAGSSPMTVRTSGYSNFWSKVLPSGSGDVVAILGYFGSNWQATLIDYAGCMNFGNPTLAPGTEDNPFSVVDAIATIKELKPSSGWVKGYIVGAPVPEVEEITSNSDVEWSSNVIIDNYLVIGNDPDTKDINSAMVINLPEGSALRTYGNLVEHPENLGKEIWVKGSFDYVMSTYGITGNTGKATEFKIEGVEMGGAAPDGNGTETSPYNVAQVIAKNPTGNKDNPDEKDVWVTGYIVGWADMSSIFYINAQTAKFTVPATVATNLLLAATPDVDDWSQCIGIQLPSGAVRTALNLQDNPGNLGRELKLYGNICKYSGVPGMRDASKYVLGGEATPDTPTTGDALYSEAFSNTKGQFIINNVLMNDPLTYVWSETADYGMKASAFINNANQDAESWLISPVFDLASASGVKLSFQTANNKFADASAIPQQCTLWVSVGGADWQQLTVPNYGNNASWTFVSSGDIDLSAYTGKKISIGFRYTSSTASGGTWEVKDFVLSGTGSITTTAAIIPGGGSTTPDVPETPGVHKADFDTFNNGTTGTNYSATYTTASGWTTTQCTILAGGTTDTDFVSSSATTLFPVLNGSAANQGILTSPELTGGLKKLSFNYGFPFSESKAGFTVQIIQNGQVVASNSVVADPATRYTAFDYSHDFNIEGTFTIKIVNDQVSASTKNNADRTAIWNLTWE